MRCGILIVLLPIFWDGNLLSQGAKQKCKRIMTPQFSNCSLKKLPDNQNCSSDAVCQKLFHLTYVRVEPFLETLTVLVEKLFTLCCGSCKKNFTSGFRYIESGQLTHGVINSSDFIFPVVGLHSASRLYGYHFIPVLDLTEGYYITEEISKEAVMGRLLNSCKNLWPLLVTMLLISVLAGFVIWLLETWSNKEEFSRAFHVGLFDGFWWSFISMTTVGYGDKSPKFFVSRLFSVLWILIGITICSMFTASLTTEITSANTPQVADMHGAKVGVLNRRIFEAAVVATHGGNLKESKGVSTEVDAIELINMLKEDRVNGIFVDKHTLMHVTSHVLKLNGQAKNKHRAAVTFFMEHTIKSKKTYSGESMAYGVLVRNQEDYEYFSEFVTSHRSFLETCHALSSNLLNERFAKHEHDLFSPSGGHFYPTLITTCCILGAILIFGIVYEVCRRKRVKPVEQVEHGQFEMTST